MTAVNDRTNDHVHVEPMNDLGLGPFHTPRSPQPSPAPVGNDAHMRLQSHGAAELDCSARALNDLYL